ncbi:hypothetical protein Tco_1286097 [Tanacetum coccineum]
MGGISRVDAVDRSIEAREKVVQLLKFHLERAQNKMKQQTDKNKSERVLELKKCKGNHQEIATVPLPQMNKEGLIEVQPLKLLDRKMVKQKNVVAIYGLIQWTNGSIPLNPCTLTSFVKSNRGGGVVWTYGVLAVIGGLDF